MHALDLSQPLRKKVGEDRAVQAGLGFDELIAVRRIRNAPASAERFDDPWHLLHDRDERPCEGLDVREVFRLRQRLRATLRQSVATRQCVVGVRLHGEDAGARLMLQPLARVALGDASFPRQFLAGREPERPQRAVEAETVAKVDARDLSEADGGPEEPLAELVRRGWRCFD